VNPARMARFLGAAGAAACGAVRRAAAGRGMSRHTLGLCVMAPRTGAERQASQQECSTAECSEGGSTAPGRNRSSPLPAVEGNADVGHELRACVCVCGGKGGCTRAPQTCMCACAVVRVMVGGAEPHSVSTRPLQPKHSRFLRRP
jgi:hypothetical protein